MRQGYALSGAPMIGTGCTKETLDCQSALMHSAWYRDNERPIRHIMLTIYLPVGERM